MRTVFGNWIFVVLRIAVLDIVNVTHAATDYILELQMLLRENNEVLQLTEVARRNIQIYKTKQICDMDYMKIDLHCSRVPILRCDRYSRYSPHAMFIGFSNLLKTLGKKSNQTNKYLFFYHSCFFGPVRCVVFDITLKVVP